VSAPKAETSRMRAYVQFLAAVLYFFLARSLASRGAAILVSDPLVPLVEQATLAFMLVFGYAAFGYWLNRQLSPVADQGLGMRLGWTGEVARGLATGWGLALVCVLPLALGGGIAISIITHASAWGWLVADTVFFAFTALAEEVAFRGYGFQRFAVAVGPLVPGSSRASLFVAMALGLVLSAAYLRTRALWVGWGINFGWKASRALLFGLAVAGVNSHSPVIQGDPMGPFWLTGGGFGLEGSWITFFLILLALPVVFRITRDLDFRYNAPVLVPAGIPVDLDAAARAQHETAMGAAEPAPPALIQIGPASTPPPAQPPQS